MDTFLMKREKGHLVASFGTSMITDKGVRVGVLTWNNSAHDAEQFLWLW